MSWRELGSRAVGKDSSTGASQCQGSSLPGYEHVMQAEHNFDVREREGRLPSLILPRLGADKPCSEFEVELEVEEFKSQLLQIRLVVCANSIES